MKVVYYNCDKCGYKSKSKQELKSHVDSDHEGIFYNCEQCGYKSKWRQELKRVVESKQKGIFYYCEGCIEKHLNSKSSSITASYVHTNQNGKGNLKGIYKQKEKNL